MKRLLAAAFVVALVASVASAVSFPVTGANLISSEATPSTSGLIGHGGWTTGGTDGGIKIAWTVHYDLSENVWEYSYTFTECNGSALKASVCHVLLEVSTSITSSNYCQIFSDSNAQIGAPQTYTKDPNSSDNSLTGNGGNPSLPQNIYAVNLSGFSGNTITFESTHSPMWGSFYAVDGSLCNGLATYVWNSGIGSYPTSGSGPFTGWIPVPDTTGTTGNPIPEPTTMALLGLGLVGVLARRKAARA